MTLNRSWKQQQYFKPLASWLLIIVNVVVCGEIIEKNYILFNFRYSLRYIPNKMGMNETFCMPSNFKTKIYRGLTTFSLVMSNNASKGNTGGQLSNRDVSGFRGPTRSVNERSSQSKCSINQSSRRLSYP